MKTFLEITWGKARKVNNGVLFITMVISNPDLYIVVI